VGRLGILAGSGELPRRIIAACRDADRDFFVLAFKGEADPTILAGVPHATVRLGAAGEGFRLLHEAGVDELVFAGALKRPTVTSLRPDWRAAKFFARIGYRALGDNGLLAAVIAEIEGEGFKVVGADTILANDLAPSGIFGRVVPDDQARADIAHGLVVARTLGALDIGQSVVIQQGLVLGVEAIEGTDALLARCRELSRAGPGGVLVKMAKPNQDRRADLPTIGVRTVTGAHASRLRGIAVEAGSTIIVDRAGLVAAADEAGLFLIGVEPG
jgi:UDP-2,3-diacylglucosamine hydrolase